MNVAKKQLGDLDYYGTKEWRDLSYKPRTGNLIKIKPLGSFEKSSKIECNILEVSVTRTCGRCKEFNKERKICKINRHVHNYTDTCFFNMRDTEE